MRTVIVSGAPIRCVWMICLLLTKIQEASKYTCVSELQPPDCESRSAPESPYARVNDVLANLIEKRSECPGLGRANWEILALALGGLFLVPA
jgi:hypothetical protein